MEALVSFMGSSYGAFLQIILQGGDVRERLFQEGAPAQFVDKFMVRPGHAAHLSACKTCAVLHRTRGKNLTAQVCIDALPGILY